MNRWQDFERAAEHGPSRFLWKLLPLWVGIVIVLGICAYTFDWFGEAADVAKQEFGAKAALQKYEWFVDQAARIEQMDAQVALFQEKLDNIDKNYAKFGEPASWDVVTRAEYNQAKEAGSTDLLATKSQRNTLVREYNAASEKFNWAPFQSQPNKPKEHFFELTAQ